MKKILVVIVIGLSLVSCNKPLFSPLPKVETLPVDIVNAIQVTFNGNVIDEGSSAVTTRGFCWALKTNPSVNDNFSQNEFGPGKFSEEIQVIPDTAYYVRVYATNSQGTTYGKEIAFSTAGSGTFTDLRDSRTYKWLVIGNQIWMFENLAYLPKVSGSNSGYYEDLYYYVYGYEGTSVTEAKKEDNYDKYGVLYNWEAAQIACPEGWHLSSDEEWKTLEKHLGMSSSDADDIHYRNSGDVGKKLKSTTEWYSDGNGTNSSGFSALPGGSRFHLGGWRSLGFSASFWSPSPNNGKSLSRWLNDSYDGVFRSSGGLTSGLSVRCLQN